ncbi:poly-beta-1,6-N-acetyl-D-glucosamine biosynthesis protein PgaD [Variovorax ginsengisoli]|uniref:Poly-beta-1,6-N-acetyl-D-glucosamine biosynthesis protein PgaD n=1 Tax=Variovorax ginsengisoli TaxID=363844 RepID=A0ABT9S4P9_9BURK|nr:poly-beta-1,6-N-acetyl-D-glucosamine biosynthesis protein PgaD [Variovorax ginsengisoli]MDP9898879.1 poly-beta-1,6-N-acetyl-D-glucosamine biosynthesis protein PgaD [Variovorax ginsengisoli]
MQPQTETRPAIAPHPQAVAAPPPDRVSGWAEPHEEPILDAARVSFKAFRENKSSIGAVSMYLWLRLLRPLLLVAFWIAVVLYAWYHFFTIADVQGSRSALGFCAVGIAVIFVVMLLIAPIRRHTHEKKPADAHAARNSTAEIADYADLAPRNLLVWQQARRLVVEHDDDGRLRDAAEPVVSSRHI